jgi:hypothetical protein
MSNITIGRYGKDEAKNLEAGRGFSAWIEGTDDDGAGWIFWLDEKGRPVVYYGQREESGAVKGLPVTLAPYPA